MLFGLVISHRIVITALAIVSIEMVLLVLRDIDFYCSGIEKNRYKTSFKTHERANELAKRLGELRLKFTNRTDNWGREIKRVQ